MFCTVRFSDEAHQAFWINWRVNVKVMESMQRKKMLQVNRKKSQGSRAKFRANILTCSGIERLSIEGGSEGGQRRSSGESRREAARARIPVTLQHIHLHKACQRLHWTSVVHRSKRPERGERKEDGRGGGGWKARHWCSSYSTNSRDPPGRSKNKYLIWSDFI